MKHLILFLFTVLLFTACEGQAGKETALKQKALLESIEPGTIAAASGSWTMTAKVDGKPWTAASLMQPDKAGRIIGYYRGGFISLPYFRHAVIEPGKKFTFSNTRVVDYWVGEGSPIEAGLEGNMELTKVNGDWVEGIFHFTVHTTEGKTVNVTDGFFRISMAAK